jgi:hypothetical protein
VRVQVSENEGGGRGGCGRIRCSTGIETPRGMSAAAAGFSVNVSWTPYARPPTHCQSTALGGEQLRCRRKVTPDTSREATACGLETEWGAVLRLEACTTARLCTAARLPCGSALWPVALSLGQPWSAAKASRLMFGGPLGCVCLAYARAAAPGSTVLMICVALAVRLAPEEPSPIATSLSPSSHFVSCAHHLTPQTAAAHYDKARSRLSFRIRRHASYCLQWL